MNLKCKIHGKEFPAVQGVTFSEEYNETLDSGSLIITHVSKIKKLRPFDDVYIYDNEFNGFGEKLNPRGHNKFYKHMLVQNFTEEILNLKDKIYKYKISLMSEIKALEKVQLPNISVTQPLKAKYKVSVYDYLVRFVNLYSPKYKVVSDSINKRWVYKNKYTVDPALKEIFGDVYSPDFTLNLPTLRDLLSKLMIVKDMIPYVEDNVIKAMDITARKKEFVLDEKHMNYITGTMNSEDYCTGLRRTYSDALSQDSTCRSVEYMGFRNNEETLMTLDNMRLETRFPIYKINKILMCYYKRHPTLQLKDNDGILQEQIFLCKQDITPLVKLNTERNVLSQDWDDFHNENEPKTIEELAKYKLCTVGYDIGSRYITGWGTKYTYPQFIWDKTKTYIENIASKVDAMYPYGIENFMTFYNQLEEEGVPKDKIVPSTIYKDFFDALVSPFPNKTLDLKSLVFIVDYQGFYNGSITTSKDNIENDEIVSNDNSSSSLALLELDGLSQKEKANRFGNKTIQISARYEDISQMQELGDVYNNEDDTDVIIYHREYSIYDNMINCIYFGVKDYVLKNYYTSVFARHRTWNLIPYSESVRRSENRKMFLYLSKEEMFYENIEQFYLKDLRTNFYELLLSAFSPSKIDETGIYQDYLKVNYGYITHYNEEDNSYNYYLSEVNCFINGYSMCFNISMLDNISMGNYIKNPYPFSDRIFEVGDNDYLTFEELSAVWFDTHSHFTGSVQNWYSIIDNQETGFTKKIGFYFAHQENNVYIPNKGIFASEVIVDWAYEDYLFKLPKITPRVDNEGNFLGIKNVIGQEFDIYKDNKEFIDMTYQIEPICLNKDVLFSPWLLKLNGLLSNYYKFEREILSEYKIPSEFLDAEASKGNFYTYCTTFVSESEFDYRDYVGTIPYIILKISVGLIESLKNLKDKNEQIMLRNHSIKYDFNFEGYLDDTLEIGTLISYEYIPQEIKSFNLDGIEISGIQKIGIINKEVFVEIYRDPNKQESAKEATTYCEDNVVLTLKYIPDNRDYLNNYYYIMIDNIITENANEEELPKGRYEFNYNTRENLKDGYIFLTNGFSKGFDSPPLQEPTEGNYEVDEGQIVWGEKTVVIKNQTMYVVLSNSELKNTLVYDEYTQEDLIQRDNVILEKNFSEIFEVKGNCINIKLEEISDLAGVKSVQYWYKDIKDEIIDGEDKNLMEFVFGVNISDQDKENGYVKIYTSLISNRNPNVYDENYNIIGKVHNYLDEDDLKPYGLDQYYDEESVD